MTFSKTARDATIAAIKTSQTLGDETYTVVVLDEQQKRLLPNLKDKVGLTYKWTADNIIHEQQANTAHKKHYRAILSLHLFAQRDDNDISLEKKAYSLIDEIIKDIHTDFPSVLSSYDAILFRVGPVKPLWEVAFHREVAHLHFEVQIVYQE